MIGIKEPRAKVVDSAGPEKSATAVKRRVITLQESPGELPSAVRSRFTPTIHEAKVELQISKTVRAENWGIKPRVPVFRPATKQME